VLLFSLGFVAAALTLSLLVALRLRSFRRHRRLAGAAPPRFLLRGLFSRLGTRPDQEEVLLADADALAAEVAALRQEGRALREELATLLEAPALDPARLDAALAARLSTLERLRARAAGALGRLHAVLDDGQRRALGQLLRRGPAHAHGWRGRC
jgi:uncharacterized membrane protein